MLLLSLLFFNDLDNFWTTPYNSVLIVKDAICAKEFSISVIHFQENLLCILLHLMYHTCGQYCPICCPMAPLSRIKLNKFAFYHTTDQYFLTSCQAAPVTYIKTYQFSCTKLLVDIFSLWVPCWHPYHCTKKPLSTR